MFFQDMISRLKSFWAQQQCVILPSFDLPVGAGTLAPPTALRCLTSTPWSACYVQGCRRPNDGRYGHNPNRLSHYYQMQVVIQPSPLNAQLLFEQSLASLDINMHTNELRFLEDDWENPSIGAAGLGWEIWLNGSEIAQCTFFQQIASVSSELVTLEFTYGLERLAMFLQGVSSIFDIKWNDTYTYGDIFQDQEQDLSRYSFDAANISFLQSSFQGHIKEAEDLLKQGVLIPAYEQCLFASHTFNLLHARGVLSVAERESIIASIRTLTRTIAQAYIKRSQS
ncbi:MAG: glycine--tRNA ligase subunit alpha [Alphaproteobacteria bacterium]|nr:glycine--tRNA ligase subunit alpha [Alphaproteobacteria bacterium]